MLGEIFGLSRTYVDKLILLYFFILSCHNSNEYGLVVKEAVAWLHTTTIKSPVSFGEAWEIYFAIKVD